MDVGLKSLAEAVILQSLEDLWNPIYRKKSKEFFRGEGFEIFSQIAELNSLRLIKILSHLRGMRNGNGGKFRLYGI
jgi:phosphatidylserine decarboxylase